MTEDMTEDYNTLSKNCVDSSYCFRWALAGPMAFKIVKTVVVVDDVSNALIVIIVIGV